MMNILVSSHAKKIIQLLSILNVIEITTFFLIRVTLAGEYFVLCNNQDILLIFEQENDIGDYFSCLAENSVYGKLSVNLWPDDNYDNYDKFITHLNNLNVCHGVSITYRLGDYTDIFSFATNASNENIKNFYLNNLHILKRFIIYFRIKGKNIIEQQQYKALHPRRNLVFKDGPSNEKAEKIKRFREEMRCYVVVNGLRGRVILTKKESEYLGHLLEGKSSRKVAEELGVSQRTIEACLENIKLKTGCHTKIELLSVFLDHHIPTGCIL